MGTRWVRAELCGDYSREERCDLGSGLLGAPPITGTSVMSPGVAKQIVGQDQCGVGGQRWEVWFGFPVWVLTGEGGFTPPGQGCLWAPLGQGRSRLPFTPSEQDSLLALKGVEPQGSHNGL